MNLTDLERLQASNVRPVIAQAMTLLGPYTTVQMDTNLWYQVLRALFSIALPASERSAMISRDYYDAERERAGLPPHLIPLRVLNFERFAQDMRPYRGMFTAGTVTEKQIHMAALRAARSVENSGRWTIMRASEIPDPAFPIESEEISLEELGRERRRATGPRMVRGWARVATGRETCGWCWMLVSRGPVYRSASSAGSQLTDRDSLQTVGAQEFDPQQHMNQWHEGCDCKVVPVFNLENWSGRDRHLAAERLWRDATKGYYGKDAINAFRRAVESGRIQDYLNPEQAAA